MTLDDKTSQMLWKNVQHYTTIRNWIKCDASFGSIQNITPNITLINKKLKQLNISSIVKFLYVTDDQTLVLFQS